MTRESRVSRVTTTRPTTNTSALNPGARALKTRFTTRSVQPPIGGFTLIELLVSIVVLSTGIVVVLEAFQTSLTALGKSRDALMADLFARERMGAVELALVSQPSVAPLSGSGRVAGHPGNFSWQQSVSGEPLAGGVAVRGEATYKVAVIVDRPGDARLQTLTTIVRTQEASP